MPAILCPITKTRKFVQPYDVDAECTYADQSSEAIRLQDVPDFAGAGKRYNGSANKLAGTRAAIMGKRDFNRTADGNNADTMKQDARVVYVELPKRKSVL